MANFRIHGEPKLKARIMTLMGMLKTSQTDSSVRNDLYMTVTSFVVQSALDVMDLKDIAASKLTPAEFLIHYCDGLHRHFDIETIRAVVSEIDAWLEVLRIEMNPPAKTTVRRGRGRK